MMMRPPLRLLTSETRVPSALRSRFSTARTCGSTRRAPLCGFADVPLSAFAISFDNFTLSLFLTSARLTPLPIELFAYLKYSFDPTAAAVSAFAIGVALVLVLGIARFMGLEEFTGF